MDLNALQQKINGYTSVVSDWFRQVGDLYFSGTPKDVPVKLLDDNGNVVTQTLPNAAMFRKRVWDDVGGALGQMSRTFYADAVNGSDSNDGSQANPFKTIKKAIDSVPVGGKGTIYLKEGQTFDITEHIIVTNKVIQFERWGSTNPKIVSKSYAYVYGSTTYAVNYCLNLVNSGLGFNSVDFEVEENVTYPNSSGAVGIHSVNIGMNAVRFYNSNITSNNLGIASGRDFGFMTVCLYSCNVNNTNAPILHIHNGAGCLVKIGGTFTSSNYVYGIVRDSNGVPRNVVSNIVL